MPRLGKRQLRLLCTLGSPGMLLVVQDKIAASLVRRGYLRNDAWTDKHGVTHPGSCCITPAGLRRLADEMEAGRVDDAIKLHRTDAERRKAKAEAGET